MSEFSTSAKENPQRKPRMKWKTSQIKVQLKNGNKFVFARKHSTVNVSDWAVYCAWKRKAESWEYDECDRAQWETFLLFSFTFGWFVEWPFTSCTDDNTTNYYLFDGIIVISFDLILLQTILSFVARRSSFVEFIFSDLSILRNCTDDISFGSVNEIAKQHVSKFISFLT